jgi:AcrR family transcriptional regulator
LRFDRYGPTSNLHTGGMAVTAVATGKRLGRPPDTDSAETRRRILDTARARFAASGYESATNRALAAEVGITAGALYHYFGSKLDLYVAVNDDVWEHLDDTLGVAVDQADGFVGKFEALLDMAHTLNEQDPTLAAFVGSIRSDMRRHPEIAEALGDDVRRGNDLLARVVKAGVASGEIDPANRPYVMEYVITILVGLTDGVSHDIDRHQRTIDSIKMMLHGALVTTPQR